MKRNYSIGQAFKLSPDALDNYGAEHVGKVYHVRQWYDHSVSAKNPGWENDPHGHPGFDPAGGSCLYGSELSFDLYEWEMEAA